MKFVEPVDETSPVVTLTLVAVSVALLPLLPARFPATLIVVAEPAVPTANDPVPMLESPRLVLPFSVIDRVPLPVLAVKVVVPVAALVNVALPEPVVTLSAELAVRVPLD